MRILFINQFYHPDTAATAQMMTDLCEHLSREGHDVHVLCSRGKYDDGSTQKRSPGYEQHNGVHIHRVSATGFGKTSTIGRIIDYLSFHILIGLRTLLTGWRFDIVVTLTTPPLIGLWATPLRWLRLTRHVCWVMDLHPDCEFELGVFSRNNPIARILDWKNGMHFRHANMSVALGPYMAKRLRDKRVRDDRLAEISVWGHDLPSAEGENPLRQELGLQDKFIVMYSGNAGLIHSFDAVCEAAKRLQDDERFAFLFVGGGKRINDIRAFQEQHDLKNIQIRSYFPREQLRHSLTMADVHLITMRYGMEGIAVPCKLYGIMAAGRPALFIGPHDCETAEQIRRHECGLTFATDDVDAFVESLQSLAEDIPRRDVMGQNAYRAFEQHFNAAACCKQWQTLLETLK